MRRVGLIAGNSDYPFFFIEAAKNNGVELVVVAIHGETHKRIENKVDKLCWVHIGQLGKLIKFFKKHNVSQCVMAGGVQKIRLFKELFHLDFEGIKFLASMRTKTDTSLLGGLCDRLAREGIEVIDSSTFLEDFLASEGCMTQVIPTKEQLDDINFGKYIAKTIAGLDVGLTIVVKDKIVVAVEAVEGTNQTIERGAKLAGKNCVVIKVARPQQDNRYDLPVIGIDSIEILKEFNINCLAIEAKKTLILDKVNVIQQANDAGIAIIGI